jgi:hypothetical protein
MERGEEVFCYKTSRGVAPFWPGIGKHKVKCSDGILREQPLDDVGNLEPQDARIRQAATLDFSICRTHSPEQTLDSQEILPRILGGHRHQKGAIPAAELDFDGHASPVNLFEIERRETIGRDEL